MHDCNGRSRREGAEGGRKRGRVTRVQRVKVEYMRSRAWYRLVVHMIRADPHRTCLSSGQYLWPLLRQTVMPGLGSPAPNARTAQPASLLWAPVPCSLLSPFFDDLGQLPLSSPSSHGTVSWYSPSQLSSDYLPFSPKVQLPHLAFLLHNLPGLSCSNLVADNSDWVLFSTPCLKVPL